MPGIKHSLFDSRQFGGLIIEIRFSFSLNSVVANIDSDRFFLWGAFLPGRLDTFGAITIFPLH